MFVEFFMTEHNKIDIAATNVRQCETASWILHICFQK